jgi:tetratricopeptide (TPR) repeat protein
MMRHGDRQHPLDAVWARHQQGDVTYAYAAYQTYLQQNPNDPTALHYLGVLAHQTGNTEMAIELLRKSIAADGKDMRVANHLGQVYANGKQWTEAAEYFRIASQLNPTSADPINNLGNVMRQTGQTEEALKLYRSAIAIDPTSPEGHYNLGKLLREKRAFDDALRSFRQAARLDPANYRASYELALCLEESGQFAEAAAWYQAALLTKPDHARSMANLLALRSFTPDATFVERAVQAAGSANSEANAKLHQGIGKYFDRHGHYARAFSHFAASNAIQGAWLKPSTQRVAASKRMAAAAHFDTEHFRAVRHLGHPSRRPLFIVGMPRSGTTLIEQVIASHPSVHGAGELMEMPRIAAALAGPLPPTILAAAQRYLDHLETVAAVEAMYVTDKLPINYRHLGVIATLFPNARIIRCRRDPRDIALSCFIEMFGIGDQDFTSLQGIAAAIVEEAHLMRHWHEVLPMPIHEVDYHRFVTNQEGETRRLLEFCGLPWDNRCLAYFESGRSIDTPSRWQVKQPIYTSSDGRWRNYTTELQPAIEILQAEGLLAGAKRA